MGYHITVFELNSAEVALLCDPTPPNTSNTNELIHNDIIIYPNPAQDILNIFAKENVENISIYSLLGQKMMQVSPNENNPSIDISSLATGLYIMEVDVNGQSATYKIVKQ